MNISRTGPILEPVSEHRLNDATAWWFAQVLLAQETKSYGEITVTATVKAGLVEMVTRTQTETVRKTF